MKKFKLLTNVLGYKRIDVIISEFELEELISEIEENEEENGFSIFVTEDNNKFAVRARDVVSIVEL